jgi:hypothetical protein
MILIAFCMTETVFAPQLWADFQKVMLLGPISRPITGALLLTPGTFSNRPAHLHQAVLLLQAAQAHQEAHFHSFQSLAAFSLLKVGSESSQQLDFTTNESLNTT